MYGVVYSVQCTVYIHTDSSDCTRTHTHTHAHTKDEEDIHIDPATGNRTTPPSAGAAPCRPADGYAQVWVQGRGTACLNSKEQSHIFCATLLFLQFG
jgi:hypothetical protein